MFARVIILFLAETLLVQSVLSACGCGCGCNGFIPAASTGGNFIVSSASPIAPVGVSVVSDNVYEGTLAIEGNLPLLGSVALQGALGTAGAGAVSYGCGDGVGIVEEGPIETGITEPISYPSGVTGSVIGVTAPVFAPIGCTYPGLYGFGGYGIGYGYGCGYGYGPCGRYGIY